MMKNPIWHRFRWIFKVGFPGGSDSTESICSSKDWGSMPGLGWSPGEGNGNLLQYSCLENSMDRGAWRATVRGVAKSGAQLSGYRFHFHLRWRSKVMRCKTNTVTWRRVGRQGGETAKSAVYSPISSFIQWALHILLRVCSGGRGTRYSLWSWTAQSLEKSQRIRESQDHWEKLPGGRNFGERLGRWQSLPGLYWLDAIKVSC